MFRHVEHGLTSELSPEEPGLERDTVDGGGGGQWQRTVTGKQTRKIQQLTVQVRLARTLLCEVCST